MNCTFCAKTKRDAAFMSPENFEVIINRIKDHTKHVYLHVLGESLLHPQLGLLLDICNYYGIKANITTNGTLINENCETLLQSSALNRINFSLHSFEENFESIGQNLESYLKSILEFTEKAVEKTNMSIYFRLWNQSKEELKKKNELILGYIIKNLNVNIDIGDVLSTSGALMLKKRLFFSLENSFIWPNEYLPEIHGAAYCLGGREQIAILVDGSVVPCCLDAEGKMILGNIHKHELATIIKEDRYKKMMEGFAKRQAVEELCKRCNYRTRFTT